MIGTDPERPVVGSQEAHNEGGGEVLLEWGLPWHCGYAVEAEQAVFRAEPEEPVRRLGNRADCALAEPVADLPRRVHVLTDVERRVQRERTLTPRQQHPRHQDAPHKSVWL